jgi:hypothetical protein
MIDLREVKKEKAENVSTSLNRKYFEISARLGINLRETIQSMVSEILKKKIFEPSLQLNKINNNKNNKDGNCCAGKNSSKNKI